MRIAFVTDVVYPYVKGGAEKRIWEVSKRLAGRGHTVSVYCMKYWAGEDVTERDGVILHGVCLAAPLYTSSGRRRVSEAVYFALRLFTPLLKADFDVLDCNQFPFFPLFTSKLCCILKRKRMVSTWHEVWGKKYWMTYLGRKGVLGFITERLAVALPEAFISVSDKTKKDLVAFGVSSGKVTVIPNGIDVASIKPIKPSPKKSDVVFVGRLIPDKNVDYLIKALSLLDGKLTCVIVGDGPEKERLEGLAGFLGVKDRVEFTGFLEYEELVSIMKSSRVFVLPSTREGFGVSVLEAFACGLPVIAVKHDKSAASDLI
ncbi:glycosyltransferase family 4 protein, partial [Patescibacteria group bacterium]|nr:glycosyltransferase family 4 protein [Patescibacteria group bacterium]MBU1922607.1 glycosyltransferase family 4 protein [Patescibacteria group bacterium]